MSEKVVPVVVYRNGERHIVGEAIVDMEKGEFTAEITAEATKILGLHTDVSSYSLGGDDGEVSPTLEESLEEARQRISGLVRSAERILGVPQEGSQEPNSIQQEGKQEA